MIRLRRNSVCGIQRNMSIQQKNPGFFDACCFLTNIFRRNNEKRSIFLLDRHIPTIPTDGIPTPLLLLVEQEAAAAVLVQTIEIELRTMQFRYSYYFCPSLHGLACALERYMHSMGCERHSSIKQTTMCVVCLPEQISTYREFSLRGVELVSPLWAISSVLFNSVQPVEHYWIDSLFIFSGLLIQLPHEGVEHAQHRFAYSALLSHYGGQICSDDSYLCTHIVSSSNNCTAMDSKYVENDSLPHSLRVLYLYFSQVMWTAKASSICQTLDDPSAETLVALAPILVTGEDLQRCVMRKTRLHSPQLSPDRAGVISVCLNRIQSCVANHGAHRASVPIMNHTGRTLHDSLFLSTVSTYKQSQGLDAYRGKAFVLSLQYLGAARVCLEEAIRWMGGQLFDIESVVSISQPELYVVSRDTLCPTLRKVKEIVSDLPSPSAILSVSHVYVYSCIDMGRSIPLIVDDSPTTRVDCKPEWNILFGCSEGGCFPQEIDEDKVLRAMAVCFSSLYYPTRHTWGIPGMSTCVVCISGYGLWSDKDSKGSEARRKLWRAELKRAIRACGACFSGPMLSKVTTHLICARPEGKKYDAACDPSWGVTVVGEQWVFDCLRHWRREDEAQYSVRGEVSDAVQSSFPADERKAESACSSDAASSPSIPLPLQGHLSPFENTDGDINCDVIGDNVLVTGNITAGQPNSELYSNANCPTKEASLATVFQPFDQVNDAHSEPCNVQRQTTESTIRGQVSVAERQRRVFLLGAGGISDKKYIATEEKAISDIETLGGVVLRLGQGQEQSSEPSKHGKRALPGYDSTCTHLIQWELKRTEKLLCCTAAGKWVLRPEYLDASVSAGKFLPEESFEWGWGDSGVTGGVWAGACRRGRERASAGSKPFEGLRITIMNPCTPPQDILRKLVIAGGGHVVNSDACLTCHGEDSHHQVDYTVTDILQGNKCSCGATLTLVTPGYLLDCITREGEPNPANYIPPQTSPREGCNAENKRKASIHNSASGRSNSTRKKKK